MAELMKAKIVVYRTPKAEIPCMFNPAEYKISTSAGYSNIGTEQKETSTADDKPKQSQPAGNKEPQYTGGYRSTLSLTLYYDITENLGGIPENTRKSLSVRDYAEKIEQLLEPEGSLHKPPLIGFIWGDLQFTGVLTSLNQDFTYFDVEGKPLRVKLDLSISSVADTIADRKSPKESPDRTKRRVVSEGTTLWKLAWEEYHDCNKWIEIASFNGLMNPMDIYSGQVLCLPPLKEQR